MPADLTVVIPTLNECGNIKPLVNALARDLVSLNWEAVFVDDDSEDGTAEVIADLASRDQRIRLLQRRQQRGLVSACITGMRAASGLYVAVMDADGQHDSSILPSMLSKFTSDKTALVIASRHLPGARMKQFGALRRFMSAVGISLCHCKASIPTSDPMSGFFAIRRAVLEELLPALAGRGFKLLPDILKALPADYAVVEVPFIFGTRLYGRSKVGPLLALQSACHLMSLAIARYLHR